MTTQQVLDKQGLQHYATKMCNAENRKVGSKSLPTALNDIDTAIDGFKTLFDNEYGTPVAATIENNSNIFTVGTGNGIDKSKEVQNSLTDIELSGNSMVNLINSKTLKEWTTAPQDELGKVVTTDEFCIDWSKGILYNSWIQVRNDNFPIFNSLKPNTDYTVFVNILENNPKVGINKYVGNVISMHLWLINGYDGIRKWIDSNMIGWTSFVYNSNNINNNVNYTTFGLQPMGTNPDGAKYIDGGKFRMSKEIIVLEGNWTNKQLPSYFEGLKSVGENEENKISILSQNKNLFNYEEYYKYFPSTKTSDKTILSHKGDLKGGNHNYYFDSPMKINLKPNATYTLCVFNLSDSGQVLQCEGCLSSKSAELSLTVPIGKIGYKVFTTNSTNYKEGISFKINTSIDGEKAKYKIMLVEGDIRPNDYIHYNQDKKEILLNEPLRSLPDGTKDTIEKIGGEWKIVRRCLGYMITGQENWSLRSSHENTLTFHCSNIPFKSFKDFDNSHLKMMCDKFICINQDNLDKRYIMGRANGDGFLIGINRNELTSQDLQGFKTWLLNNQVKVVMELETPIIEDIDPVFLKCWKDGTISIDEILPVESTHTVALNKPAQIQSNIEELTSLRNRVQKLEEQYNSTILTQAYQTILLNFDNDL